MNPQLAFDALSQINTLTAAMSGGLSAAGAYLSIAEFAAQHVEPFIDVCEELVHSPERKGQLFVTHADIAKSLEAVVPGLERDASEEKPEAVYLARSLQRELKALQGESSGLGPIPAGFRTDATALIRRFHEVISHQTLNPLAIAAMNLQMLQAGASSELQEQIRLALDGVTRASRFVQHLREVTQASEVGGLPSNDELAQRIEALFRWIQPVREESGIYRAANINTVFGGVILYAEDEPDIAEVIIQVLRQSGYPHISYADSGEAALEVFSDNIAMLVSDYHFAGSEMTGIDLARKLREKRPALPVIITTGSPSEVERQLTANEKTSITIFTKPFASEDLTGELDRTLKAS